MKISFIKFNTCLVKTLHKIGIHGYLLYIAERLCLYPKASILLIEKTLGAFPLKIYKKQGCLVFPLIGNIALDVLVNTFRHKGKQYET